MAEKRTVCLDFDGVLSAYRGWVSEEHTEPPVSGAREFVENLLREGIDVAIHTTRPAQVVMEWCDKWGFAATAPFPGKLRICKEKPLALLYVDDRGFRFTGDWQAVKEALWQPPWWKEEKYINLIDYIKRQEEWSGRTFGHGVRTKGITAHIRKELIEIEAAPHDVSEWVDVIILALDGAWRAGYSPEQIVCALGEKQDVNFKRTYGRPKSEDEPSEHIR